MNKTIILLSCSHQKPRNHPTHLPPSLSTHLLYTYNHLVTFTSWFSFQSVCSSSPSRPLPCSGLMVAESLICSSWSSCLSLPTLHLPLHPAVWDTIPKQVWSPLLPPWQCWHSISPALFCGCSLVLTMEVLWTNKSGKWWVWTKPSRLLCYLTPRMLPCVHTHRSRASLQLW